MPTNPTQHRHLGDVVRERREQVGITPYRLSVLAGVSQSLISRLESHEHHSMSLDNLTRIGEALGTTADELLRGTRDRPDDGVPSNEYPLEEWLVRDRKLTPHQREVLITVYRSFSDRPGQDGDST